MIESIIYPAIYLVIAVIILGGVWQLLLYIAGQMKSPPFVIVVINVLAALILILVLLGLVSYFVPVGPGFHRLP